MCKHTHTLTHTQCSVFVCVWLYEGTLVARGVFDSYSVDKFPEIFDPSKTCNRKLLLVKQKGLRQMKDVPL